MFVVPIFLLWYLMLAYYYKTKEPYPTQAMRDAAKKRVDDEKALAAELKAKQSANKGLALDKFDPKAIIIVPPCVPPCVPPPPPCVVIAAPKQMKDQNTQFSPCGTCDKPGGENVNIQTQMSKRGCFCKCKCRYANI